MTLIDPAPEGRSSMSEIRPADYVASRRVGDATVTAITDASGMSTIIKMLEGVPEEVWRREVEADANGEVRLSYNVAHVKLGDASILIDLGFDDPSPTSPWKAPRHLRTPGVQAGLATIGVRPSDVTHVLVTHNHSDHIAGGTIEVDGKRVPRFPNARHYLGRLDWEGVPERSQPDSALAIHLGTIDRLGLLDVVGEERELVPGVTMLHSPGETPGHSIVRVESGGAAFYFLGDLFHHPCEVAHSDWVARGRDAAQMRDSRERLIAEAYPKRVLLMTTHMPFPGWGRLELTPTGPRWLPVAADQ
jgi:glyoxylase-like metal-dependent hydrolase (beta-lactamase superfamily II)